MSLRPPTSTLFPYTTLFRSDVAAAAHVEPLPGPGIQVPDDLQLLVQLVHGDAQCFRQLLVAAVLELVHVIADDGLRGGAVLSQDRKSTRLNSSHLGISYAVF